MEAKALPITSTVTGPGIADAIGCAAVFSDISATAELPANFVSISTVPIEISLLANRSGAVKTL
jgi:hypothetical protein